MMTAPSRSFLPRWTTRVKTERRHTTTVILLSIALIGYSWGTAFGGLRSWPYIVSNLAVTQLTLSLIRRSGLTDDEIGIAPKSFGRGVRIGGGIGLLVAVVIIGLSLVIFSVFSDVGGRVPATCQMSSGNYSLKPLCGCR
jgi:hypothetical protein